MDQITNTNVLLGRGVIVRILQVAGEDRFMIQIRSTLPTSNGRNTEYYLPTEYVPRARRGGPGAPREWLKTAP